MQISGPNTYLRIICLILITLCILGLFTSASANDGNIGSANDNQTYGNISIDISPEEKITQPGVSIHPVISIENVGDVEYQDVFIIFQAKLGREMLPSDQSTFPAPGIGVTERYPLSFLVPSMQPGEYPIEILISIYKPGSEEMVEIEEVKVREWIQVGLPKPGPGARSCGCK